LRAKTIEKLKAATKYDSTQQLLEKYGDPPTTSSQASSSNTSKRKSKGKSDASQIRPGGQRTGMRPPPTANIRRDLHRSTFQKELGNFGPQDVQNFSSGPTTPPLSQQRQPLFSAENAEFAPNAFSAVPQYSTGVGLTGDRWYDRILDLLLGEDETLPKNRVVLICKNCRLVNGQAPPGIKNLEEIGKWRCGGCGGWNGEENEATNIIAKVRERAETDSEIHDARTERGLAVSEDAASASAGEKTDDDIENDVHDHQVENLKREQNT